jgi:dipeptidyl aminopeptidase/acylaminoacyl peptidase
MDILLKTLLYYAVGSVIGGFVMGGGFATNLSRGPDRAQRESIETLGTYIPLKLDGITGGLIAASTEPGPTIVYVHGRSANRSEMIPLARALLGEGYNAVLWDSTSRKISYGPDEIRQIHNILVSIRSDPHVDPDNLFIIGFSLGGAMAIGAAGADPDRHIRGIVADSAYADLESVASRYVSAFGVIPSVLAWPARRVTFSTASAIHSIDFDTLNPADWAERILCPVLLVHGKSDWRIPPQNSEQILERLGTDKELWLVDNAGHTGAFSENPGEYVRRVADFLSRSENKLQGPQVTLP